MLLIEIAGWILALEGLVLALIILLWAVTHFRDQLIAFGWLKHDGWIAQRAADAERRTIWRVLKEIGFREDHYQAIARSLDVLRVKKRHGPGMPLLSQRLLIELKPWTVQLEEGFSYKNSGQYYVDTMGAMSLAGTETASLASLLDEWVVMLEREDVLPAFDIVLTLKDGNVTMIRQFLMRSSPAGNRVGILCKGPEDKSRVKREHRVPHETDFEGLRALFDEGRRFERLLNAIAVDDNCTGGSSLCHAMRSFNELIKAKDYPITPVKHAVVLFAVKSDNTRQNFLNDGFELHALLSLGGDEMAELLRCHTKEIKHIDVRRLKQGFGCKSSLELGA